MVSIDEDAPPKEEHRLDGALQYNGQRIDVLITELNNLANQLAPIKLNQAVAEAPGTAPSTDSSEVVATVYSHGRRIDEAIGIVREQAEELEV